MEPFAYEKRPSKMPNRLFVAGVAVTSLSIWYFDLIPQLSQVPTGTVDTDSQTPSPDDFLALLEAEKRAGDGESLLDDLPTDPIRSAEPPTATGNTVFDQMLTDTDPLENSFPEFGELTEPSPETSAQVDPDFAAGPFEGTVSELEQDISSEPATAASDIQVATFTQEADATSVHPAGFTDSSDMPSLASTPPVISAETAEKLRTIDQLIQAKSTLKAHAMLSEMYLYEPQLKPVIQDRIDQTASEIYINPHRHFAEPYVVDYGETLGSIAKKHHVPWTYLARLNSVTPETLQAGQTLKVLKGPFGAVVDLKNFELMVHCHGWYVRRYRIGTGKDQSTPIGTFKVQTKLENPEWYNPDGGVVDADDPNNPLGEYWLGLGDHIGIHGTIDPSSIGKAQSRGCIHMADQDIADVFHLLSVGSSVKIRP